jgi:hypothetical protein
MCVIIHRKPNVDIPFEKLQSACLVNADGFGLVIPDRGKLEVIKEFDSKGNNPDKLAKLLEKAKDKDVFIHLRFKTKGATDLKNVHPFIVSTRKSAGIDVQFMHNGTLSDFGNQADCDSKVFTKEIVAPLYRTMLDSFGSEKALNSPIFAKILRKYSGNGSVFTLVDGLGNHLIINRDNGKEFDGWWASNEYSFNRTHREPTTSYAKPGYYGNSGYKYKGGSLQKEEIKSSSSSVVEKGGRDSVVDSAPFTTTPKTTGAVHHIPEITGTTNHKYILPKGDMPTAPYRQTFCEAVGIDNLEETTLLSPDNIKDLVAEYPEHASLLIMDLITELYDRQYDAKELAA